MQALSIILHANVLVALFRAFGILLVCLSLAHAADKSGRRIALVIGNGNYQQPELGKLPNPTNDADDMAKALRGFGFEVLAHKNLTLEGMNRAIAEFGSKIGGSEAALFYYAGHGIQVKNQNYLIPVNAAIESEATVPYQGVNVNQVLDEMDNGKSSTNIVMLDACRNNPLTGKFRSGASRGLASPASTPKGTVIVYATDPGNVAADGSGRNGLFTAGLLTAFKGKDLSLDGVLTVASAQVEQQSGQTQTPYVNGPKTLQKNFNFRLTVEPGNAEIERTFWSSIERSSDTADFEAYLRRYPSGSYQELAQNRLRKLKAASSTNMSAPVPAPTGTPAVVDAFSFDGQWAVDLVCERVSHKGKLVKGFRLSFPAQVREGQLRAQLGEPGGLSSLTMQGLIQPDGLAELHVSGYTGDPAFSLGLLKPRSPYNYRMRGAFTKTSGKASRIELRPCEATFVKG